MITEIYLPYLHIHLIECRMTAACRMLSSGPLPEDQMPFYALGINVALQVGGELKGILSKQEIKAMLQGFDDSMLGQVKGSEQEIMQSYGPALNKIITSRANLGSEGEKQKGQDFIADYMKKNPSAVKTASGLVYHELKVGTGKQAMASSTVLVHYHGSLTNGTVFDSSVERGEPIKFPLKQVIAGWQEGVARMKAGGKATLLCPSDLAYGDRGSPPAIPAGATLRFDVELIDVM
jgi:FKBP-type peptidyl-prolyl cis-trans isomerase FkpA